MDYETLKDYCYEIDHLYKIPNSNVICMDETETYITVDTLINIEVPLYLPFEYKGIPLKLWKPPK